MAWAPEKPAFSGPEMIYDLYDLLPENLSHDDKAEAIQEGALAVLETARKLNTESETPVIIYQLAANEAVYKFLEKQPEESLENSQIARIVASDRTRPVPSVEDEVFKNVALRQSIHAAMDRLSPRQKEVVIELTATEGGIDKTQDEIADKLKITRQRVARLIDQISRHIMEFDLDHEQASGLSEILSVDDPVNMGLQKPAETPKFNLKNYNLRAIRAHPKVWKKYRGKS